MTAEADSAEGFIAISKAAADPLRRDILQLLRQDSFGVLELCHILGIAQPALSHHLKLLHGCGLVTRRRDGNASYYRRALHPADSPLRAYVDAMFDTIDALPLPPRLAERVEEIYLERAARSRKFFADNAAAIAAQQALIAAPEVYLPAVSELLARRALPGRGHVGERHALDVGTGDGAALGLLADVFDAVTGIDDASAMLAKAEQRVRAEGLERITLRQDEFTGLTRERFDAILFSMVLHHAPSPAEFIAHACKLLTAGGLLLVIELCSHDQAWARDACGDVWLGFDPDDLDRWARAAGLTPEPGQFLAQRNGFRLQIKPYTKGETE